MTNTVQNPACWTSDLFPLLGHGKLLCLTHILKVISHVLQPGSVKF